jgi:squalene-hopene/tetraprenyl-beta-curcumene cyclase
MSLASIRAARGAAPDSPQQNVIARGTDFIVNSVRPDGSWPIDSNLSIWVTTLSINALAAAGDLESIDNRDARLAWLLDQPSKDVQPYTGAAAGAWGWSHLPGSVPDCDDTPGALLAVRNLAGNDAPERVDAYVRSVARNINLLKTRARLPDASGSFGSRVLSGLGWVRDLQNRDGGWPTFCRGWGKLPFDRSGSDLTAHALRALHWWSQPSIALAVTGVVVGYAGLDVRAGGRPIRFFTRRDVDEVIKRGLKYLADHQRPDGAWLPLWFGNQHAPDDINPVYGTARVLAAYRDLNRSAEAEAQRGIAFLLDVQNADGGWGGAKNTRSSVEETALAVEVLIDLAPASANDALDRGIEYLVRRVEDGSFTDPSPIGFYFAKLWYFEKLYPIIFTVAALGRAVRRIA